MSVTWSATPDLQAVGVESAAYEADVALKNICNHIHEIANEMRRTPAFDSEDREELLPLVSQLKECADSHDPDIVLRSSEVEKGAVQVTGDKHRDRRSLETLHGLLLAAQMRSHQVGMHLHSHCELHCNGVCA